MLLLQFTIILFLCVFPKDSMYNFLLLLFSVRFKKFHCTHPNVQGWSVTSAKFAKTHVYILYKYIHGLLISCLHKVLTSAPSNTFEINWNWAGPYRLKSLLNLTKLLWLKGSESLHPCSKIFLPSQKTRNLINGNGIRIISSIMTFVYNVQVTICCTVFYLKLDYNILCSLSMWIKWLTQLRICLIVLSKLSVAGSSQHKTLWFTAAVWRKSCGEHEACT